MPNCAQPPPEFSSVFGPIRIRATLDQATGAIACDNAGISFDDDVRAEWYPDEEQGPDGDGDEAGGPGKDSDSQSPRTGAIWPPRVRDLKSKSSLI